MRADGYDPVAGEYAAKFAHELEHKPFDREWLLTLAVRSRTLGWVCDLGCGPGQVARYLQEQGAYAFGIDGSSAMVRTAATAHPNVPFVQADMRTLPLTTQSLGAIAAFYALIHIPPQELTRTILEWRRVLVRGGLLLIFFPCWRPSSALR